MFARQDDDNDDHAEMPTITHEAQIDRLREIITEPTRFERGDIVKMLGSAGSLHRESREKIVLMFWRYLDTDSCEDQTRIAEMKEHEFGFYPTIDCLLAHMTGLNSFQFLLCYSGFLVKVQDNADKV